MPHPLVLQLRFTRSEFKRALEGVTEEEAQKRFLPMNCISWNVGHLAWQEQRYWLHRAQGQMLLPSVNQQFAYGAPACTPTLAEVWAAWEQITTAADPWLDSLTTADFATTRTAGQYTFTFGTLMQRMLYHYWFHIGENMAIRQMLGHTDLPQFVGNIDAEAPYIPE
ncbi:MAG: DinB family protein [Anaerolineae bacterium]|nr:DinB family protein [Anaerolineae bacterium]